MLHYLASYLLFTFTGLTCANFSANVNVHSQVPLLGFHQYDKDVGTKEKYFEHLRWSPQIYATVDELQSVLFHNATYAAAHIRVADAHWEHSDCHHTIRCLHLRG